MFFFIGLSCLIPFYLLLFIPFSFFCLSVGIVGLKSLDCKSLSSSLALPISFNTDNNAN